MRRSSRCLLVAAALAAGCAQKEPRDADPLSAAQRRLLSAPGDLDTHLELSAAFLRQGDYMRARQYLSVAQHGLAVQPGARADSERLFRLAIVIAVRSQQYAEAIRRCTQRLEEGEDAAVRGLLALLLEAVGDEEGAVRQLRLQIALHPQEPQRLVELAQLYERSPQLERRRLAHELYRRYLEVAPSGPQAALARAALALDQLEQADAMAAMPRRAAKE